VKLTARLRLSLLAADPDANIISVPPSAQNRTEVNNHGKGTGFDAFVLWCSVS